MKKWLLVLACPMAFGQITLDKNDFGTANQDLVFSIAVDPTIDFISTGANYTWDFSNLQMTSQEVITNNPMSAAPLFVTFAFGSSAPTPYKATYFAKTTQLPLDQITSFLPITLEEINLFTRLTDDSVSSVGYSLTVNGTGVPVKSDTIEKRYDLPLTYNDAYSSRGYSKINFNPFYNAQWIQHRGRNSVVDGWGTITTPNGTFDAVRVKHEITETDSILVDIMGFQQWIPLQIPPATEYEWWAKYQLRPVLKITTNNILGNETVTDVRYKDNLAVGLAEATTNTGIYPNPVQDFITVTGLNGVTPYTVYNSLGQVVKQGEVIGSIDLSNLSEGAYVLVIANENQLTRHPFIKY